MDAAVLAAAWEIVAQAHAKDIRVTVQGLDHSQKVSLEAKLLEPKDALTGFDGLYTDEFVHPLTPTLSPPGRGSPPSSLRRRPLKQ
jgi:hypothetical protein